MARITMADIDGLRMPKDALGNTGLIDFDALRAAVWGTDYDVDARRNKIAQALLAQQAAAAKAAPFASDDRYPSGMVPDYKVGGSSSTGTGSGDSPAATGATPSAVAQNSFFSTAVPARDWDADKPSPVPTNRSFAPDEGEDNDARSNQDVIDSIMGNIVAANAFAAPAAPAPTAPDFDSVDAAELNATAAVQAALADAIANSPAAPAAPAPTAPDTVAPTPSGAPSPTGTPGAAGFPGGSTGMPGQGAFASAGQGEKGFNAAPGTLTTGGVILGSPGEFGAKTTATPDEAGLPANATPTMTDDTTDALGIPGLSTQGAFGAKGTPGATDRGQPGGPPGYSTTTNQGSKGDRSGGPAITDNPAAVPNESVTPAAPAAPSAPDFSGSPTGGKGGPGSGPSEGAMAAAAAAAAAAPSGRGDFSGSATGGKGGPGSGPSEGAMQAQSDALADQAALAAALANPDALTATQTPTPGWDVPAEAPGPFDPGGSYSMPGSFAAGNQAAMSQGAQPGGGFSLGGRGSGVLGMVADMTTQGMPSPGGGTFGPGFGFGQGVVVGQPGGTPATDFVGEGHGQPGSVDSLGGGGTGGGGGGGGGGSGGGGLGAVGAAGAAGAAGGGMGFGGMDSQGGVGGMSTGGTGEVGSVSGGGLSGTGGIGGAGMGGGVGSPGAGGFGSDFSGSATGGNAGPGVGMSEGAAAAAADAAAGMGDFSGGDFAGADVGGEGSGSSPY